METFLNLDAQQRRAGETVSPSLCMCIRKSVVAASPDVVTWYATLVAVRTSPAGGSMMTAPCTCGMRSACTSEPPFPEQVSLQLTKKKNPSHPLWECHATRHTGVR